MPKPTTDEKNTNRVFDKNGNPLNHDIHQISQPQVDPETAKPTVRAISEAKQAWEIAKTLKKQNDETRVPRNAEIASMYNGGSPFSAKALRDAGQGWRNNFSTNPLASVVDRVKPQFPDSLQRAKYLTASELPALVQDARKKSQVFQTQLTKCVRGWPGWEDFLAQLSQEEVLFGYTAPVWLDPNDWRGRIFPSGEIFFPEGTGQNAKRVQVFAVQQEYLIHEFCELFDQDQGAAKSNGYDVAKCIEVANRAIKPKEGENALDKENRVRESYFSDSFAATQKTISVYHIFVREYMGGVDLWTVDMEKGEELRHVEGIYEEMPEALTLFTLQTGNCRYYGSKGLGRLLVNLHIAIERGRNLAADQIYLSGLAICQVDDADLNNIAPVVRHPFIVLPKSVAIAKETINFDAEGYAAMDQKWVELMESIAGAFIPAQLQTEGSSNTKIEAANKVAREEKVRQGVLGRFNVQAGDLINMMQVKICSPINLREAQRVWEDRKAKRQGALVVVAKKVMDLLTKAFSKQKRTLAAVAAYESKVADTEAVECMVEMLEGGLSAEEIAMLALAPSTGTLATENQEADDKTIAFIQAAKVTQDPYVNQKEATAMTAELTGMGQSRIDRLILTDEVDQTITAEGTRQQLTEFHDIMAGDAIPVSPRDNHKVHRETFAPKAAIIIQTLANPGALTPALLQIAQNALKHYEQHVSMDQALAKDPKALATEKQAVAMWGAQIKKAQGELAKQQQANGGNNPANMPPPVNGQPVQAGPDGNIVGEQPSQLEHLTAAADISLRADDQKLRARDQQLKAQAQDHQQGIDRAKLVLDANKLDLEAKKAEHGHAMDQIGAAQHEAEQLAAQEQMKLDANAQQNNQSAE